jgi:predicted nicotinamide N-methyase
MPGYQVAHEQVAVVGVADLQIRSLLDRQQFADPLGEAAALGISSAAWPLFGLLWPSGRRLAALMAVRPLVVGERVLEMGCGLALASLVSHRRGVDITASDCHPLAEAFLAENLRLNGLASLPYRRGRWGADPVLDGVAVVEGRFDLIVASDVLYERDEHGELAAFISRHARASSQVLIVDPNRGNRPAFNRRMAALGYALLETCLDDPLVIVGGYRGRLLDYRRIDDARLAA